MPSVVYKKLVYSSLSSGTYHVRRFHSYRTCPEMLGGNDVTLMFANASSFKLCSLIPTIALCKLVLRVVVAVLAFTYECAQSLS